MANYEPKAIINKISATSRASLKTRNGNYFTVEYSEERIVPNVDDVDIIKERNALWDAVNAECDAQLEIIHNMTEK